MSSSSASPPARRVPVRRRDLRLAAGVVLVLVSVVVGSRVVAGADARVPLLAVRGPLAAGTTLTADDLVVARVRADDVSAYLPADADVVGRRLGTDVSAGELLPATALVPVDLSGHRLVTLAVDPLHEPADLDRGARVDVWVTPDGGEPQRVLVGVVVADAGHHDDASATTDVGIVLDLPEAQAGTAVAAAHGGQLDLVRVGP